MLKLLNWQDLVREKALAQATLPAKGVSFTCSGHLQINSVKKTLTNNLL